MEEEGLFGTPAAADPGASAPGASGRILERVASFAAAAAAREGLTVVVGEEVGMGLVPVGPDGPATRRFLDLCGEAAQVLASSAGDVRLVVAGRSLELPASRSPAARGFAPPPPVGSPVLTPMPPAGGPSLDLSPPAGELGLVPFPPTGEPPLGALRLHGDAMVPPGALDFAVNVVPGPPPPWLTAAIDRSLAGVGRYPDDAAAVRAVAGRHGRGPDEVLPLNGSAEEPF